MYVCIYITKDGKLHKATHDYTFWLFGQVSEFLVLQLLNNKNKSNFYIFLFIDHIYVFSPISALSHHHTKFHPTLYFFKTYFS